MNKKLLKLSLIFATPITIAPISASCKIWEDIKPNYPTIPSIPNSTPLSPEKKDEGETDTNAFFNEVLTEIPKWEVNEKAFYGPHGFFHYGNNIEWIKTSNGSYISKDEYKDRLEALEKEIVNYRINVKAWLLQGHMPKQENGSPKNPLELDENTSGKLIEYGQFKKALYEPDPQFWKNWYGIEPDGQFLKKWKIKFQFFGESNKNNLELVEYLENEDNRKCFEISNESLLIMFYPLWNMYYQGNTTTVTNLTTMIMKAKKLLIEKIQNSSKTLEEQLKDSEIIKHIKKILEELADQLPAYKALEYKGKFYAFPLSNNKELYNHAWYYKQLISIWNDMWAPLAYLSGTMTSGNDFFFDRPNEINSSTDGESATKGQTAKYMFDRKEYGSSAKGCYIPKLIHHSYSTAISTLKSQKDYLINVLGLKFKSIA
ncbi:hypothetical protein [Metamycoplasma hyosynoviae]|uniref:hypothetical protein n=1 Tax=Metamycoplasma hyosynoviae TaxID=29559 RepID=UPI000461F55E|nr:hypothetical protein [Metamycoplasma hyosynoviae]KDE43556.1 hypothetical protein NPL1_00415 [Metamycoplasma hyosynoviae]MDC8900479.1 hypothetical protein [Metamycoplasma hyosynoviae]MDC8911869.1 hypothetical protein [Metamycoplasma hyosynoviae]MDC8937939.1 hypothetical protein [Metamycoplasma hyosynoviae]MDD1366365.1 hypothetical protein [Metamycoplasma hyosynoviae]